VSTRAARTYIFSTLRDAMTLTFDLLGLASKYHDQLPALLVLKIFY